MAKSLHNLGNFSGGEVSPKLDARADQPKYATWLRQCQNMIPFKSGGLTRRPGTQYIAQAKLANVPGPNGTYLHNYAVAMYPFVFSPSVTFELEVGHNYIRFYSQGQQVSLVTANLPLWITTAAYTAGQFVNFSGNGYYCIASISGTPFPGNVTPDVDTTHWVQQNVLEVPTPYIADCGTLAPAGYAGISSFDTDPYVLTTTQINDLVYFVHPLYPPQVLTRNSNTNWTFEQVPFLTPALLDQNATDTQIAASGTTGSVTLTTSAPAWSAATYYTLANSVSFTWSVAAGAAGSTANPMLSGSTYIISTSGTVNWTALGAAATTVGTQFVYNGVTATGAGGQCQAIYNCVTPNQSTSSFLNDVNAGYWQQYLNFNSLHVGSTWQLAYLNPASYLEVDGTAVNGSSQPTGFATWTDSGGGSGTCVSTSTHYSSTIQCIGQWEVHTYGVWAADISIQRSTDGGNTWQTIRTVQSRSDRNVDITGTAVQLGLYRFGLTIPASVSGGAVAINPGATYPRIVFEIVDGFLYGLVNITAVTNNMTATATVVTQLASTNPTEFWSEAAWSNYRGFPQAITSFQQRIIYGGSGYEPQRIWGTVTNDIQNFALGDQTLATDSFAFDLNAPMRGPIQWLIGQTDLICGFSGAEWIINSGSTNNQGVSSGAAIGPTNINAVEHSTWGTAELVQPIIVGDAVLYSQRQSTTIRQMMFSFYTAKYMSQDLTMLSEHLFSSGIVQMAFMTRWRRQSIIWTVTRAGTLCGMTYELDQEVFGWHRHVTGFGATDTSGNPISNDNGFESVATNFGQGTAEDEVWVVVNRLIGGVQTRFIERINPNVWEEAFTAAPAQPAPNLSQAFYVDCGSTIPNPGSTTIGGLYYLNGRYVVGLADGNPFGPLLVSNGTVTLPASIPSTVVTVNIGLPIAYAAQPMRFEVDQRLGNTQGLVKQISDTYLRVWNSCGGSVSNGTSLPPNWVSGTAYPVGSTLTSPANLQTYYCVVPTSGASLTLDPSANVYAWNSGAPTGNWALTVTPVVMQPVPIPYPQNTLTPFVSPMFISTPTDLRIKPMPNVSPGDDPIIVVQGNDALPLTVLGLFNRYDLTGIP